MKNLLAVLGIAVLGSTVVSPLINQQQDSKAHESREIYWDDSHQELEFTIKWSNSLTNYFRYEVKLGRIDMLSYKWISVIDSNNASYTKTSWGNTPYFGTPFSNVQRWTINSVIVAKEIVTNDDILNYSRVQLLLADDHSGFARFNASQNLGMSYYARDGEVYLQVFGYQTVSVTNNLSGGAMWMNIGQGIRIEAE